MELLIGLLGFISILVLMGIGVHVSVAIGLPAIVGLFILLGVPETLEIVSSRMFSLGTDYSFTAVPLFLLMGYIAMASGITKSAFDSAAVWLRRIPGGLAMAACVASAPIGACMGSGVPATVALSKMAIPDMISHKYDKGLASGTIAATATMASLIPPSIMMVVYAIYAQVSLGQMLLAGYIPAILTIAVYILSIALRVRLKPALAPESRENGAVSFKEYGKAFKGMWGIIVLFAVLFISIYSGLFTATEAAALAAFTAFILMAVMGKFKLPALREGFKEAVCTTAVLFILLIASNVFVVFIDVTGLPRFISNAIVEADLSLYGFLAIIMLVYLIMGIFLPSLASLLLTIPVLLPVMTSMNINMIWFGILFVKMSAIGAITPPFGMSVFVVKGVVGNQIKIGEIFRGISWFFVCEIVVLVILIAFPEISLWLPGKLG